MNRISIASIAVGLVLLSSEDARSFETENTPTSSEQEVGGIGIQLKEIHGSVYITNVIPGSPAWNSKQFDHGGDIIRVSQDGENFIWTDGMRIDSLQSLLRGKVGTPVWITLSRGGLWSDPVYLVRASISSMGDQNEGDKMQVPTPAHCEFIDKLRYGPASGLKISSEDKAATLGAIFYRCNMGDSIKGKVAVLSAIGCITAPQTPLQEKMLIGSDSGEMAIESQFETLCNEVSKRTYFATAQTVSNNSVPEASLEEAIQNHFVRINTATLDKGKRGYSFLGNTIWIEDYNISKGAFPAVFEWKYKAPLLFGAMPEVKEVQLFNDKLQKKADEIRAAKKKCHTYPIVCDQLAEDALKDYLRTEAMKIKPPEKMVLKMSEMEAVKIDGRDDLTLRIYFKFGKSFFSEAVGPAVQFDLQKVEWRDNSDNVLVEYVPDVASAVK